MKPKFPIETHCLKKGDRVRMSAAGLRFRNPRNPLRIGTVIGFSRDKSAVWVRWDGGHRQGDSYARKFIALLK